MSTTLFGKAVSYAKAVMTTQPPEPPPSPEQSSSPTTPSSENTSSSRPDMLGQAGSTRHCLTDKHAERWKQIDKSKLLNPDPKEHVSMQSFDKSALAQQKRHLAKKYQKQLEDMSHEIEALKDQVRNLSKSQSEAQKQCTMLEEQLEGRERDVRNLQSQKLQSVESAQWAPMSNSSTHHEISSIISAVRQWSQTNTPEEGSVMYDGNRMRNMHGILVDFDCLPANSSNSDLVEALQAHNSLKKAGKAATLLLTTIASTYLLRDTLADPFFFCQASLLVATEPASVGTVLRGVQKYIARDNKADAEAFRCQLVRSISTSSYQTKSAKAALVRQVIATFMQRYAPAFITDPEMRVTMRDGLEPIVEQVIELAWQVWTRKARLDVLSSTQLASNTSPGEYPIYFSSSGKLELHSMHGRQVDDDP